MDGGAEAENGLVVWDRLARRCGATLPTQDPIECQSNMVRSAGERPLRLRSGQAEGSFGRLRAARAGRQGGGAGVRTVLRA